MEQKMNVTIFTRGDLDIIYRGVMALFLETGIELLLWRVDLLPSKNGAVVWKFREILLCIIKLWELGTVTQWFKDNCKQAGMWKWGAACAPDFPR